MTYEFITDRFEIMKLSEAPFTSNDRAIVDVDYADVLTIRRISTLKYAIKCKVCSSDDGFIQEIPSVMEFLNIPVAELSTYLVNIRINGDKPSMTVSDLNKLMQVIYKINPDDRPETGFNGLYTVNTNPEIPRGEYWIDIILGVDKTEEDKIEDEKYESMLAENRGADLLPSYSSFPKMTN